MNGGMKKVSGRVLSSKPLLDDWDDDDCLCQGKVTDDRRIDVQVRIYDEKRKKHRWRNMIRYHMDCPVHGTNRGANQCPQE
jgi:hypothetical protein